MNIAPTPPPNDPNRPLSAQESYNLVSDTVIGANLRVKDNVIQAIAIAVCVLISAPLGGALAWWQDAHPVAGALVGGLAGLIIGLFASGIFLMIYRVVRHARGEHG